MSELEPRLEKQHSAESIPTPEKQHPKTEKTPEKSPEEHTKQIESLKHRAHAEAKSGREVKVDKAPHHAHQAHLATKELKDESLRRTLQRVRKHLSSPDKTLSKVIHQPVVDTLSKVGEKTIARPKGILIGSIVALVGSSYLLYTAKRYGFTYNYLTVFILFAGGYLLGLIFELLVYTFRRGHKS